MKLLNSNLKICLLLAAIIGLFYANTLQNGFVYDDVFFIQNNEVIKNIGNIPKILFGCITSSGSADCKGDGVYYHPLLFLQLMLVSQISPEPWFFHLANLGLFLADGFLIFKLLETVFGKRGWALVGALIFIIHPINSELGNFISTVNDHYLLIFFILTFLSFKKFIEHKKRQFLYLSLVFYFLAMLAKEIAILMVIPIFIYNFYLPSAKLSKSLTLVKLALFFLIPLLLYLFLRLSIFGSLVHHLSGYHDMNLKTQVLTAISIYPLYLSKLIYPLPLNAQHDPPLVTEFNITVLISIIFWIINFYLIFQSYKRGFKNIIFGFSIIFLSLLPILILINKIGRFIFSERYLLLAVLGFTIIWMDIIIRIINISKKQTLIRLKNSLLIAGIMLIISSWWVVFNRNKDWHNEFSFNKSIARFAKENFGVHYNLGINYLNLNEFEQAKDSFEKAAKINPDFWASSNALDNLNLIQSGTSSATYKLVGSKLDFRNDQIAFSYPVNLKLTPVVDGLNLIGGDFKVEFRFDKKIKSQSFEDYLKLQTGQKGKLLNQGLAQVPGFDYSYAKIWEDLQTQSGQKLELFLFKQDEVIQVLVYPANSGQMSVLDAILGSLTLTL